MSTVAGDVAGADVRVGNTAKRPSADTLKNMKRISRTRFKDFVTKTKVVPSKKEKEKNKKMKHKGRQFDNE